MPGAVDAKAWFPFDMAVDDFWVSDEKGFRASGQVTVPEGTVLSIHCAWSVRPTQYVEVKQPLVWQNVVKVDQHTQGIFPIQISPAKYGKTTTHTGSTFTFNAKSHEIKGTMELKGEFKTGWKAYGAGPRTLSCVLDSQDYNLDLEKARANNERKLVVHVTAGSTTVKPTPAGPTPAATTVVPSRGVLIGAPASPSTAQDGAGAQVPMAAPAAGQLALAKANLSVLSASAQIQAHCEKPQPALIATVTVKNNGAALAANKGTIFLKEIGGANLSSAGINIPAIGAGQTHTFNIPAISVQTYSSLPGPHQLQVLINPLSENGQPSFAVSAPTYVFTANFPRGHCQPVLRQQPLGATPPLPERQTPATSPDAQRLHAPAR